VTSVRLPAGLRAFN